MTRESSAASRPTRGARSRLVVGGVVLVVVIALPQTLPSSWTSVIGLIFLSVVGAAGLNILQGCAGQLSIGNAGFMAIGSFVGGSASQYWHLPFLICLLIGTVSGVASGVIVGVPALRIRGLYLLVGTLALVFVIQYAGTWFEGRVTGPIGLIVDYPTLFGWSISSFEDWYYVFAVAAGLALLVFHNLDASKLGRALRAIKTNEQMAACLGVDPRRYIIFAFAISSGLIALQGALLTFYNGGAEISEFSLSLSFQYVAMIIIGGEGSLIGTVAGPAIIVSLPFVIGGVIHDIGGSSSIGSYIQTNLGNLQYLIFGAMAAIVMMYAPRGLGPILEDAVRHLVRRLVSLPRRLDGESARVNPRVVDPVVTVDEPVPVPGAHPPMAVLDGSSGTLVAYRLRVRYGDVIGLQDVSFAAQAGELLGIVGPNGAGKTTTLRGITGFLRGERARVVGGNVWRNGVDLSRTSLATRAQHGIALVPESNKVFPGLTVEENLAVSVGKRAARSDHDFSYDLFPPLQDRRTSLAGQLSGGERQMLAMARALIRRPGVLLIDEFSLGLAPAVVESLYEMIARLRDSLDLTVVVVDEKLEFLTQVATHLVVLNNGRVAMSGPADGVTVDQIEEGYFGMRAPRAGDDAPYPHSIPKS